jgi:hypothetical protein
MQHISQLTQNFVPPTESETKQFLNGLRQNVQSASATHSFMTTTTSTLPTIKSTPPNDLALFVWITMGEIYGNQWTTAFGEEPNKQWTLEIGNLTMREVLYGIEQCKHSGSQFVPNLPQFLAYCKAGNKVIGEGTRKLLALPKPPPNPEVRKAEILKMFGTSTLQKTGG